MRGVLRWGFVGGSDDPHLVLVRLFTAGQVLWDVLAPGAPGEVQLPDLTAIVGLLPGDIVSSVAHGRYEEGVDIDGFGYEAVLDRRGTAWARTVTVHAWSPVRW